MEENTQQINLISSVYQVNPGIQNSYKIKKIKSALTQDQQKELLQIAEKQNFRHYIMIKTQIELGLRVSELCNLTISQLDLCNGFILVQSYCANEYLHSFKVKTPFSNRTIPLSIELAINLKNYIGNRKTGYVFESNKHGSFLITSVIGFINKYARQCLSIGHNIGSSSLRRTYAISLIQIGLPIPHISQLLGHKSSHTTIKYLFQTDDLIHRERKDMIIVDLNGFIVSFKKLEYPLRINPVKKLREWIINKYPDNSKYSLWIFFSKYLTSAFKSFQLGCNSYCEPRKKYGGKAVDVDPLIIGEMVWRIKFHYKYINQIYLVGGDKDLYPIVKVSKNKFNVIIANKRFLSNDLRKSANKVIELFPKDYRKFKGEKE